MPNDVVEALNCPNYCSGNGECDIAGKGGCICYDNFGGIMCDIRLQDTVEYNVGDRTDTCNDFEGLQNG